LPHPGWLERFKKRHNITFKTVSGEAGSVSPEDGGQFQEKLPSRLRDYNPRVLKMADSFKKNSLLFYGITIHVIFSTQMKLGYSLGP
jgi:hypothetical protein